MILLRNVRQHGADTPGSVAIADNRIVAIGPDAETWGITDVVDLDGGTLLPAFGDGHAHPVLGGLERQGPAITEKSTVDEIVAEIGRWAREHPGDDWIVAASYDPALAPDGAFRRALAGRRGAGPTRGVAVPRLPRLVV